MYEGCGGTKTCFGLPEGCVESMSCRTMVAITVRGERYEFELKSGFSKCLNYFKSVPHMMNLIEKRDFVGYSRKSP